MDENQNHQQGKLLSSRNSILIQGITFDEYAKLTAIYSDPTRHYHSLSHIHQLFGMLQRHLAAHPGIANKETSFGFRLNPSRIYLPEVSRALWFHDSVYNPYLGAGECELYSAQFSYVENDDVVNSLINQDLVYRMIIATAHHLEDQEFPDLSLIEENSIHLVLDLDLASSLTKDWKEFNEDTQRIRKEYAMVDEEAFHEGRMSFFKAMLKRKSIFYTKDFKDTFEAKARENMQTAVDKGAV